MPKDIDHLPGETAIHARRVVQKITPIEFGDLRSWSAVSVLMWC